MGTPYYLSPEICANRQYNQKVTSSLQHCQLVKDALAQASIEAEGPVYGFGCSWLRRAFVTFFHMPKPCPGAHVTRIDQERQRST